MGKDLIDFSNVPSLAEMQKARAESPSPIPKEGNTQTKVDTIVSAITSEHYDELPKVDVFSLSNSGDILADEMEDYLKRNSISSGDTGEVNKTPIHYLFKKTEEAIELEKFRETKHFELGTFAHMAFLEPSLFDRVKVEKSFSMASHAGMDVGIEFYHGILMQAYSGGLLDKLPMFREYKGYSLPDKKLYLKELKEVNPFTMIDEKHNVIIKILKKHYKKYAAGLLPKLLKYAVAEHSFYHFDDEFGLELKCRPDALLFKEHIGIDATVSFKTTRATSIDKYLYDCASFKYHVKESFYQRVVSGVTGRDFSTTIMVVLQTVPPYLPYILILDDGDMEIARHEMETGLQIISEIETGGKMPVGFESYAEPDNGGIITPRLPEWISKGIHPTMLEDGGGEIDDQS